ncbi:MAG TPA: ParA family protein [Blastocatellia bacterium]
MTRTIAVFSNRQGVGNSSLVYHLAWMYRELGLSVIAADLDPQAGLTSMFLDEDRINDLWDDPSRPTVSAVLESLLGSGNGDIRAPHVEEVASGLGLLVGDVSLSSLESEFELSCGRGEDGYPINRLDAFWRMIESATRTHHVQVLLIDLGQNLGAISRAALAAAEHIVIPLAPDIFSLRALERLGPKLRAWQEEWEARRCQIPPGKITFGAMCPVGYTLLNRAARIGKAADARWRRTVARITATYHQAFLEDLASVPRSVADDPHCLAVLKPYNSLMDLAGQARKPMFLLTAADGAIGGHAQAVRECYSDFRTLALKIVSRAGVDLLSPDASGVRGR